MTEAATAAVETPAAQTTPPAEPAKGTQAPAEAKKPDAPKPPPSAKDWSAVTIAEKRLTQQGKQIAEREKAISAKEAQLAEREKASGSVEAALKKAYNEGDWSALEKDYPELYKRYTQAKLKSPTKGAPPPAPAVTEEAIIAKLEAKAKADHEKALTERWQSIESSFAEHVKTAGTKYPLLAIEWEDDPDLIRNTLRDMDKRPTALTFDAASAEMETWLKARLERRQKALAPTGQVEQKTPSAPSPGDTAGTRNESGGPTTLSNRLSQESALPASPASAPVPQGDDPVSRLRRKQEQDQRDLERATAEFVALRK